MSKQIQSTKIQSSSTSTSTNNKNVQSKNVQNQNSQKLFLAKCLVEQQLESQIRNTQISIRYVDGVTQFRTRAKKIAAISQNGNLYVFAKPVVSFKGLPLDCTVIPLNRIEKIDGVMRCVKCKKLVSNADVSQCPCGGYLKERKRFQVMGQVTESLDESYLEIQAALEDMRISARIDRRPRVKTHIATGIITRSMAGKSSIELPSTKTIHAGFLTAVSVKHSGKQPNWDDNDKTKHTHLKSDEKYSFFKSICADVESIQSKEIQEMLRLGIRERAKIAVTSWDSGNNTIPRDTRYPINEKRKQRHSTTPKKHNTSIPTQRKTHAGSKYTKTTTCNFCLKKVAALVGPTCQDCFLRGCAN